MSFVVEDFSVDDFVVVVVLVDADVVVGEAVEDVVSLGFFVETFTLFVLVKDTP